MCLFYLLIASIGAFAQDASFPQNFTSNRDFILTPTDVKHVDNFNVVGKYDEARTGSSIVYASGENYSLVREKLSDDSWRVTEVENKSTLNPAYFEGDASTAKFSKNKALSMTECKVAHYNYTTTPETKEAAVLGCLTVNDNVCDQISRLEKSDPGLKKTKDLFEGCKSFGDIQTKIDLAMNDSEYTSAVKENTDVVRDRYYRTLRPYRTPINLLDKYDSKAPTAQEKVFTSDSTTIFGLVTACEKWQKISPPAPATSLKTRSRSLSSHVD